MAVQQLVSYRGSLRSMEGAWVAVLSFACGCVAPREACERLKIAVPTPTAVLFCF